MKVTQATRTAGVRRRPLPYERKKKLTGFLFTLPWLLGLIYFFLMPLFYSFLYSFSDVSVNPGSIDLTFVGLRNFDAALFTADKFIPNLASSVTSLFYQVPLIIIFSMFVAVILNQKFRGRIFLRGIFFLPLIISSGVVLGIMRGDVIAQSMMSGQTESALFQVFSIQDMLLETGLPYEIVSYIYTFINGIFDLIWKSGIQILLFLAGLQTVSESLYEAASIEGASAWETFWKITVPMLFPVIQLTVIYSIIDSFTDASSNAVMIQINDLSRQALVGLGVSAAMACMYFVLVGVIITAVLLIISRTQRR